MLPSHDALAALLVFVLTCTGARRGTLSIADTDAASLRAYHGFDGTAAAAAFANSPDAVCTRIDIDEHGILAAIIALECRDGDRARLSESLAALLRAQIPVLLQADCLTIDVTAFRHNFASIIDDALEPFVSIDAEGAIREWNGAAASTFGWSRAEALGRNADELILAPERHAAGSTGFERYVRGASGAVIGERVTLPAVKRDGSRLSVEMRVAASTAADGRPLYHAFLHDVTDVEAARRQLSRSAELLRATLRLIAVGSYELDLNTGEPFCSDELYQMLGYDPQSMTFTLASLQSRIHPDDAAAAHAAFSAALSERRPHDYEHRMLRRGGDVIVVRRRGYFVLDDAGRPARLFGTVEDVTAARAREADRRDLESRFTEAFDNAPLGISIINAQPADFGTVVRANPAYCRLVGYSHDDIVGRHFTTFLFPEDRAMACEVMDELLARRAAVVQREARLVRQDGSLVWVRQTRSLMFDAGGAPLYFFTHIDDVTQRRADQAALAQVNARLQRLLTDAPIGMALTSVDPASLGRFIEVNPALCRLTGRARHAFASMSFDELVHPEGRARSAAFLHGLVTRQTATCTYEERFCRADGTFGWMSVHASIAYDRDERPMYCIAQIVDISERKAAEAKLEHLAFHDGLTGSLNRRGLTREIERRWGTGRVDTPAALLLLDLDHFKYVNDTMGYARGDSILTEVYALLRCACPADAMIARLGGDEFLIMLAGVTEAAAVELADEIGRLVASRISISSDHDLCATVSIGIAIIDAWTADTVDEAIGAADSALALAKGQGRNRSIVAPSLVSSHSAMRDQLTWSHRIRQALERGGFALYAQPILNLRSGIVERYELLIRMIESDGTVVFPNDFLPVAERIGLITDIDRWVVKRSIEIAAAEQRAGRNLVFEVNLSGASLTNESMAAFIEREIRLAELDPRMLVFEITETVAIENMARACSFAEQIAALGCAFALDDFGAGFSSFYYLKYLPFSDLKIDGEFIKNLVHDTSDQHIVRAIVEVARGLGKSTIAEFVGDAETALLLQTYGVDYAQGYYIGKPAAWAAETDAATIVARR